MGSSHAPQEKVGSSARSSLPHVQGAESGHGKYGAMTFRGRHRHGRTPEMPSWRTQTPTSQEQAQQMDHGNQSARHANVTTGPGSPNGRGKQQNKKMTRQENTSENTKTCTRRYVCPQQAPLLPQSRAAASDKVDKTLMWRHLLYKQHMGARLS